MNEREKNSIIKKSIHTHTHSESCVVNGFWRKQSSRAKWIEAREKKCVAQQKANARHIEIPMYYNSGTQYNMERCGGKTV